MMIACVSPEQQRNKEVLATLRYTSVDFFGMNTLYLASVPLTVILSDGSHVKTRFGIARPGLAAPRNASRYVTPAVRNGNVSALSSQIMYAYVCHDGSAINSSALSNHVRRAHYIAIINLGHGGLTSSPPP